MHHSPVLYYESPNLTEVLKPNSYFVKAAIICDEAFKDQVDILQKSFYDTPVETYFFKSIEGIREFISAQKMGTCLYLLAKWDDATEISAIAVEEGVSEEELQIQIVGSKRKYVYCMKCYVASEVDPMAENVQCGCGAHLNVGPFFSKVRKGYIGYPFIPEN